MQFYVDGSPYGSPVTLNDDGEALIQDANLPAGHTRLPLLSCRRRQLQNQLFADRRDSGGPVNCDGRLTPPRPTRITAVVRSRNGLLSITVAFNEALDPGSAVELGLYSVFGGVQSGTTIYSKSLGIKTITYHRKGDSVTIKLAAP